MKRLLLILTCLYLGVTGAFAQVRTITGSVVYESDSTPVIGATVVASGTMIATMTGPDGQFSLSGVPESVDEIQVSFIGMKTVTVPITDDIRVALVEETQVMETLVVMGYGSARKIGSVVGSVSLVDNVKLKNQPTSNFSDALQGQVAGLSVLSSTGEPSQTASIRLRGINSIMAGVTPLFILDGAPVTQEIFSTLNPGDIENVVTLKDASSTAIYGSRAANGVIVITTRKGRIGQEPQITLKAQYGFSNIINSNVETMNTAQYFQFREMLDPSLAAQTAWHSHKQTILNNGIDTDWKKYIYRNNAPTYTVDASVVGGGERSSYYFSASHNDTKGIAPTSHMARTAIRANLEMRPKDWFRMGFSTNVAYQKYNENPDIDSSQGVQFTNPSFFAMAARPDDSPYYYTLDSDGKAIYGDRADYLHQTKVVNPLYVESYRERDRQNVALNLNVYQELRPTPGLVLRAAQAMDGFDYTFSSIVPPVKDFTTPMGDEVVINSGSGARTELFQRYYNFTFTNTAEYSFSTPDNHYVSILLGQESIFNKNNSFNSYVMGLTDPRLVMLSNGTETLDPVHTLAESVFNSYFFRVNYDYMSKYFVDVSYRIDQSSRFPKKHRTAEFYSIGGKWNLKAEAFMERISWVDELSLKASYGTTGNSSIGNYAWQSQLGGGSYYYGSNAIGIAQPGNDELTWETVVNANVGLDFTLFGRFTVGLEFYNKKTKDMLMTIPTSVANTGYNVILGNMGAMLNTGFDANFNIDILRKNDMHWSVSGNFNYNKNKITELFNGKNEYLIPDTGIKLQVGKPYGEFFLPRRQEVDPRDGKQVWLDHNGNRTKTYSTDHAVFLGKQRYAPWSGGFGTSFLYRGLSVSADFAFVLGKYASNIDRYFIENSLFGATYNQSTTMLNMWTTPGQITDIPAASEQIYADDDHLLENASFLRLKNVSVNYSLPGKWFQKNKIIERVNVFATGRNLLTITNFSGLDPEPDYNLITFTYPNTRQYVFGIEVVF